MKEVMATARNIHFTLNGDKAVCVVEAVVSVSESSYQGNAVGELKQVRIPETLRFGTSPAGMRVIAKSLNEWADEADKACEKITAGDIKLHDNDVDQGQ